MNNQKFKLTELEKQRLRDDGEDDDSIRQIEECALTKYTVYYLYDISSKNLGRISRSKTIELLGRERFISGLHRSSFHFTSMRTSLDGKFEIIFDTSKYFKE